VKQLLECLAASTIKADAALGGQLRPRQLPNCLEYFCELGVVSAFKGLELPREFVVRLEKSPQPDEGTHDFNIDRGCSV
jgi:hypothetical protein